MENNIFFIEAIEIQSSNQALVMLDKVVRVEKGTKETRITDVNNVVYSVTIPYNEIKTMLNSINYFHI